MIPISEHSASFTLFHKKNTFFVYGQGVCPPPLYDHGLARNLYFAFTPSLLGIHKNNVLSTINL